jgi:hypothetical protein
MRASLLLLAFSVSLSASELPDGLCKLYSRDGGFGHGFVIGNKLISSAHVTQSADGKIFCSQKGTFVEITKHRGRVREHPFLLAAREQNFTGLTFAEVGSVLSQIEAPFDLSVTDLSETFKSDFILDPSFNIEDSANLQGEISDGGLASITSSLQEGRVQTRTTTMDIFAVEVRYDENLRKIAFQADGTFDRANLYTEYDLRLVPGESGAPLYLKLADGSERKLVIGVARGNLALLTPIAGVEISERLNAGAISPSIHLAQWLKASDSEIFYQGPQDFCNERLGRLGN